MESCLKWIGGKNALSDFITERMAPHKRYVEVFTGSSIVYLNKSLASINILNDFNGNLINLYKVINDERKKNLLQNLLNNIVYSRELFSYFLQIYKNDSSWIGTNDVTRALIYLYLNKVSFNGQFKNYATREDSSNLYILKPILDKMFNKFQAGKVIFEKLSFEELLLDGKKYRFDEEDTFIYLDPPYWVTTIPGNEYYEKLMSKHQHENLRDILLSHKKAKWMLSYDNHIEVKKMYGIKEEKKGCFYSSNENIYAMLTPEMHQSSASLSDEQVYKEEILISNYNLESVNTLFE